MPFSRPPWLRLRTVILLLIGLLFFWLVGWFVWKTWWYYNAIRTGKIDPALETVLSSSSSQTEANSVVTAADLLRLQNKKAPTLGTKGAPLTIVEFLDYDCPFCRDVAIPVRQLMEAYQDQVFFVVRDFPIEALHPRAFFSALAARCAQEQGKYWPYHDKLFADQEQREDEDYQRFALEVGLDEKKFDTCYKSQKHKSLIQEDVGDGVRVGVQGTPTFFFNGTRIQGALTRELMEKLVQRFLAQTMTESGY